MIILLYRIRYTRRQPPYKTNKKYNIDITTNRSETVRRKWQIGEEKIPKQYGSPKTGHTCTEIVLEIWPHRTTDFTFG